MSEMSDGIKWSLAGGTSPVNVIARRVGSGSLGREVGAIPRCPIARTAWREARTIAGGGASVMGRWEVLDWLGLDVAAGGVGPGKVLDSPASAGIADRRSFFKTYLIPQS